MNAMFKLKYIFTGGAWLALGFSIAVHAATPLWSITPGTATTLVVPSNGTANVNYTITNNATKSHILEMKDIPGVTVSPSTCSLAPHATCQVTLTIDGSKITSKGIKGGPVFCQQGNSNSCYQPSSSNILNISLGPTGAEDASNGGSDTAGGKVAIDSNVVTMGIIAATAIAVLSGGNNNSSTQH